MYIEALEQFKQALKVIDEVHQNLNEVMNVDPQALLRTNIYKVNVFINMSIVNEKQENYEEAFN